MCGRLTSHPEGRGHAVLPCVCVCVCVCGYVCVYVCVCGRRTSWMTSCQGLGCALNKYQ